MALMARNAEEAGSCRNKSRQAVTLSDAEQAAADGDKRFLELLNDGDTQAVEAALDAGQMINVGNENCESTIHITLTGQLRRAREAPSTEAGTATSSDVSLLTLLVKRGAYVDYCDKNGKRPLNVCMDAQHLGVPLAAFLLGLRDASGARVVQLDAKREQEGISKHNTLLHDAAWAGNAGCVRLLLETGGFADLLESENAQGQTALHLASFRGSKELVQLLTGAGANHRAVERNPRRLSKDTPDVMAAMMGRQDSASYLKSLGTTIKAVQAVGRLQKGIKPTGGADA